MISIIPVTKKSKETFLNATDWWHLCHCDEVLCEAGYDTNLLIRTGTSYCCSTTVEAQPIIPFETHFSTLGPGPMFLLMLLDPQLPNWQTSISTDWQQYVFTDHLHREPQAAYCSTILYQ